MSVKITDGLYYIKDGEIFESNNNNFVQDDNGNWKLTNTLGVKVGYAFSESEFDGLNNVSKHIQNQSDALESLMKNKGVIL